MYDKPFTTRIRAVGWEKFVKSVDTIAGIIAVALVYIMTGGVGFSEAATDDLLQLFARISASLFAIILTGLTIVTSFTDKEFIYAWKKIENFDEIMTIFQYYLYLPLFMLLFVVGVKYLYTRPILVIFSVGFFTYMIVGMFSLVGFIVRYGLQRGEFIRQQMENREHQGQKITVTEDEVRRLKEIREGHGPLTEEELKQINDHLSEKIDEEEL